MFTDNPYESQSREMTPVSQTSSMMVTNMQGNEKVADMSESFPAVDRLDVRQTPLPDYPDVTNEVDLIASTSMTVSFTLDQSNGYL